MMTDNQILEGDCLTILKQIPDASVDLVVTDPPYFVRYKHRAGRSIANDGDPRSVFGAFDELYRVLRPETYCVSFYGWNSVAAFFDAWTRAGFKAVGHIVWHKGYASRRGFLNARHEQAYVLVKGRPTTHSANRRCSVLGVQRQHRPPDREGGQHSQAAGAIILKSQRPRTRSVCRFWFDSGRRRNVRPTPRGHRTRSQVR
ncbi:MAG: methylase [Gammaproteobacteria bacterium]|nr:methylase [Gammaproteobacteria bacterium]